MYVVWSQKTVLPRLDIIFKISQFLSNFMIRKRIQKQEDNNERIYIFLKDENFFFFIHTHIF